MIRDRYQPMTTIITNRPNWLGERGFLSGWPEDVVYVVNGQPITKSDILQRKRDRQRVRLAAKLRNDTVVKPCFVWTFYIPGFPFGPGWWLYVKTLKNDWLIDNKSRYRHLALKIMRLFPCGYLPMIENFKPWKEAFAKAYHYPTQRRPKNQGMTTAWATIDTASGRLIDINLNPMKEDHRPT